MGKLLLVTRSHAHAHAHTSRCSCSAYLPNMSCSMRIEHSVQLQQRRRTRACLTEQAWYIVSNSGSSQILSTSIILYALDEVYICHGATSMHVKPADLTCVQPQAASKTAYKQGGARQPCICETAYSHQHCASRPRSWPSKRQQPNKKGMKGKAKNMHPYTITCMQVSCKSV